MFSVVAGDNFTAAGRCDVTAGGEAMTASVVPEDANWEPMDAGRSTASAPPSFSAVSQAPQPTGINHLSSGEQRPAIGRAKTLLRIMKELGLAEVGRRNMNRTVAVEERLMVRVRDVGIPIDPWIDNILTYYLYDNGEYICPYCRRN